ncbi:CC/Se motif family (seleno)protein [Desulfitobacterium sp.]|uniref:CC/Se motif family (seleno)protein n=1 Tax=Desulfitobacterium sp. TaxID=49981 RepID=UPI002B20C697|nr:CC/Se motif family (seleno)protein [Desulfitobacterium sp.]MEA4901924.1 CC/Se motif family (seleno)protein [Desulfitobacterium sp.]
MDLETHIQKPMISLKFTPEAKDFLFQKKVDSIHIISMDLDACCIPVVSPPAVRRGAPHNSERFITMDADGITVYYDRCLPKRAEIIIELSVVGFFKNLRVANWRIKF